MGPEMSQFLSGMKKTMEQVVMPNLTDRFAQEQAGIVAATLGFLEQIHDKVFHYELLENHLYKNLLGEVVALLDGATPPQHEVAVTLVALRTQLATGNSDAHLRPYHFVRGANETMKEHLCTLIRNQPELPAPLRESFDALLRPFFRELEVRERAWVKPLGFDAKADELPDIDELLYRDGKLRLPGAL
ncbi:MAG: hypothetical protein HYX64_03865 [Gammaproteobacteria bacterium]|nr:hypothetical protein [Gammaproteobacteria bacterium]